MSWDSVAVIVAAVLASEAIFRLALWVCRDKLSDREFGCGPIESSDILGQDRDYHEMIQTLRKIANDIEVRYGKKSDIAALRLAVAWLEEFDCSLGAIREMPPSKNHYPGVPPMAEIKLVDPLPEVPFPATRLCLTVQGPIACCQRHADALTKIMNAMGVYVPSHEAPAGSSCINCLNEAKKS